MALEKTEEAAEAPEEAEEAEEEGTVSSFSTDERWCVKLTGSDAGRNQLGKYLVHSSRPCNWLLPHVYMLTRLYSWPLQVLQQVYSLHFISYLISFQNIDASNWQRFSQSKMVWWKTQTLTFNCSKKSHKKVFKKNAFEMAPFRHCRPVEWFYTVNGHLFVKNDNIIHFQMIYHFDSLNLL